MFRNHGKQAFSTIDMDQDASSTLDCSKHHENNGGWWFYNCFEFNINGQELGSETVDYTGIVAQVGEDDGWVMMKDTVMKIQRTA